MTIRVLIVDDSIASREAIRLMLEDSAMLVIGEASHGEEAVERYRALGPDLAVIDLVMPRMNGVDTARAILALNPKAILVAASGLSQASVRAEAAKAGFRGFLAKPFTKELLLAEISKAFET